MKMNSFICRSSADYRRYIVSGLFGDGLSPRGYEQKRKPLRHGDTEIFKIGFLRASVSPWLKMKG